MQILLKLQVIKVCESGTQLSESSSAVCCS